VVYSSMQQISIQTFCQRLSHVMKSGVTCKIPKVNNPCGNHHNTKEHKSLGRTAWKGWWCCKFYDWQGMVNHKLIPGGDIVNKERYTK
jgi:hypothetical protein